MTVQLDGVGPALRDLLVGEADPVEAAEGPVFVDESGRRRRQLRRVGVFLGIVFACYAVVLVLSVVGGNASAPWLGIPGQNDDKADTVVPAPSEDSASESPGTTPSSSPGATPTVSNGVNTTPTPTVSGSGPSTSEEPENPTPSQSAGGSSGGAGTDPDPDPVDPPPTSPTDIPVDPDPVDPPPSPSDTAVPSTDPTEPDSGGPDTTTQQLAAEAEGGL